MWIHTRPARLAHLKHTGVGIQQKRPAPFLSAGRHIPTICHAPRIPTHKAPFRPVWHTAGLSTNYNVNPSASVCDESGWEMTEEMLPGLVWSSPLWMMDTVFKGRWHWIGSPFWTQGAFSVFLSYIRTLLFQNECSFKHKANKSKLKPGYKARCHMIHIT